MRARAVNPRGQGPRLRQDILDAATALLGREPAVAVTLRAIARQAGVAAPSIYAHFPHRERTQGFVNGRPHRIPEVPR